MLSTLTRADEGLRKGEIAIGLNGEHLTHLAQLESQCHVTAGMVVGEHHEMVCSIVLLPVRVIGLHMLQRLAHQLRCVLQAPKRLATCRSL